MARRPRGAPPSTRTWVITATPQASVRDSRLALGTGITPPRREPDKDKGDKARVLAGAPRLAR